jgi:multicomponent Na+:H+ antiporter subunit D
MVKGSLLLTAGVLLHRLRTMSEPVLYGRGRPLRWTALLWFLGAAGPAGAPPFGTMLGDSLISAGSEWFKWIFLVAGALTSAAVARVGIRVFFGWGDCGPMDQAAKVDELPETEEHHQKIQWFLFVLPAFAIAAGAAVSFPPELRERSMEAAARLLDQSAYAQTVFRAGPGIVFVHSPKPIPESHTIEHGLLTLLSAVLLALAAVFHRRLPRRLRLASHLEGSMHAMRVLQSGHPGDYVAWLTAGSAVLGGAIFLVMR